MYAGRQFQLSSSAHSNIVSVVNIAANLVAPLAKTEQATQAKQANPAPVHTIFRPIRAGCRFVYLRLCIVRRVTCTS
jgi:hypothetical protein